MVFGFTFRYDELALETMHLAQALSSGCGSGSVGDDDGGVV